jgi:hypothetical protein
VDELAKLMQNILPGHVDLRPLPPDARQRPDRAAAVWLDRAEETEQLAAGCILFHNDHFVAFRKIENDHMGSAHWRLIDSTRGDQPRLGPAQFLMNHLDQGPGELIGWYPNTHPMP